MGLLGRRMLALATLVVILAVGWVSVTGGDTVGMPLERSLPLGLMVVGVTGLALQRVYSYGDVDSPIVAGAVVLLFVAAIGAL